MTQRTLRRLVALATALAIAAGCSASSSGGAGGDLPSTLELTEEAAWGAAFDQHGVEGTFVLHEIGSELVRAHNAERAAARRLPASTFKILNSLIALETETLADVDEEISWDGVVRSVQDWNQDHSLRSGIAVSAVWAYQHLARQVGAERMSELVEAAEYGNADIGGPIDEFWLNGDLRISPLEQLDFLSKLVRAELPFDSAHQSAVREILVREEGDGWVWGHKTGTALAVDPVLGWLVGYTEFADSSWVFAMNIDLGSGVDLEGEVDPKVRQRLTSSILEMEGALPQQAA